MNIAYFIKNSFVDFPSTLCSVIFLSGCNMNCEYCHNKDIVNCSAKIYAQTEIFEELNKRKDFIDGVVVTGGEPTLQSDLPKLFEMIKSFGLKAKLDTNGTNFKMIKYLIDNKLVDYIAMDIKASREKYDEICQVKCDLNEISKSIEYIKNSGIEYEFRTTVCGKLDLGDFQDIGNIVKGASNFYLQRCNEKDAVYADATELLLQAQAIMKQYCDNVIIRNL